MVWESQRCGELVAHTALEMQVESSVVEKGSWDCLSPGLKHPTYIVRLVYIKKSVWENYCSPSLWSRAYLHEGFSE